MSNDTIAMYVGYAVACLGLGVILFGVVYSAWVAVYATILIRRGRS